MVGTLILIAVLLLVAMVLIVVEICTPMFGLLGLLALGAAGEAVYLAWALNNLFGLVLLIVAAIGLPVYIVAAVKILPRTALGSRLRLRRIQAEAGEGTPEAETLARLVGRTTTAETVLRPSGMIRVDGKRITARAESGMIEKGRQVRIIAAAGNRVTVRQTEE